MLSPILSNQFGNVIFAALAQALDKLSVQCFNPIALRMGAIGFKRAIGLKTDHSPAVSSSMAVSPTGI